MDTNKINQLSLRLMDYDNELQKIAFKLNATNVITEKLKCYKEARVNNLKVLQMIYDNDDINFNIFNTNGNEVLEDIIKYTNLINELEYKLNK